MLFKKSSTYDDERNISHNQREIYYNREKI